MPADNIPTRTEQCSGNTSRFYCRTVDQPNVAQMTEYQIDCQRVLELTAYSASEVLIAFTTGQKWQMDKDFLVLVTNL